MAEQTDPIRVEEIDWPALLPFVQIFRSFRTAIGPAKMVVALLLVVALYLFGLLLDGLFFGDSAYRGEPDAYATRTSDDAFARWRIERPVKLADELTLMAIEPKTDQPFPDRLESAWDAVKEKYVRLRDELAKREDLDKPEFRSRSANLTRSRAAELNGLRQLQPQGVFAAALSFKLDAFERLVSAATSLRFGFAQVMASTPPNRDTVVGAVQDLVITLPCWLAHAHGRFLMVWLLGATALCALLGGAVCRMAALQATRDERISIREALKFARDKWVWLFLSPLIPLLLVLLIWLPMAIVGLVFNVPVLDVLGSIIFGLALFGGFVVALILIGLAGGFNLLYPAIAVEGSESFDALSRVYHYVFFRAWRLIFYNVVALVYGAATYLFVGALIFLILMVTQKFAGSFVWASAPGVADRFELIMPPPQVGQLGYELDWSSLAGSAAVTAALIKVWSFVLVALLGAYAVSYYYCAQTWIYLLLRRAADGTEYDDVYLEPSPDEDEVKDVSSPADTLEVEAEAGGHTDAQESETPSEPSPDA